MLPKIRLTVNGSRNFGNRRIIDTFLQVKKFVLHFNLRWNYFVIIPYYADQIYSKNSTDR